MSTDSPDPSRARRAWSNAAFAALPISPLLVVGAVALVTGAPPLLQHRAFVQRSASAKGTVIRIDTPVRRRTYPVVEYTTSNGERIQFRSRILCSAYEVGQEVAVSYEPQEPRTAEINSFDSWMALLMTPLFGALLWAFCLAGLLAVYVFSRGRSTATTG